jgi:DNA-binding NarL/FixJ family response regulator
MKIRVAIVEDTKDIREALEQIISNSEEFECLGVCENGEVALEQIPIWNPQIVLMDIHLPGISGIECVSRLKLAMPKTQFVMCTIFQDDENIFNALRAGAIGYLLKNNSPTKILDALMELHSGGSPMSAEIARRVVLSFQSKLDHNQKLKTLSQRESEILQLLATGLMYKEIAAKLNISTETVRRHVHNIYEKLHVQTRTEAINIFYGK